MNIFNKIWDNNKKILCGVFYACWRYYSFNFSGTRYF